MTAGAGATFVIRESQTEIDGVSGGGITALAPGALWRWSGQAVCVDAPGDLLLLSQPIGEVDIRRRAGRRVRHILGDIVEPRSRSGLGDIGVGAGGGFVLTDGRDAYAAAAVPSETGASGLIVFGGHLPPRDRDLWVVEVQNVEPPRLSGTAATGFTTGTVISTPLGPKAVETLKVGDLVATLDGPARPIVWTAGYEAIAPTLRLAPGALGGDAPLQPLELGPGHKVLLQDGAARAAFRSDKVFAAALDLDLIGGVHVAPPRSHRFHLLMLPVHAVVLANGLPCESLHPRDLSLPHLDEDDRRALAACLPDLEIDPESYGPHAHRVLTRAETAILSRAPSRRDRRYRRTPALTGPRNPL